MHIAYLTPEYPHPKISYSAGIGTSIKNLVLALVDKRHKVTIFVYSQDTDEIFEDSGITIYKIAHKKYTIFGWYLYRKYLQIYINEVILKEGIQLIEAPDWTGITAFMKFKTPLVIRLHGSDTYFCYLEQRKQKWKNFLFEKIAILDAKAFIAPTTYAGEISRNLFRIKHQQVKTIHYGLDLDKFEKVSTNQYDDGLILYIGTIIRKKGVLELPAIMEEVIKKYAKAHLVLIGVDSSDITTNSASTWNLLESKLSIKLKQKITYVGKVPYEDVQLYIKKAHVCVFPTHAETLGMVTIESMAMQKAVVNSNIGWAQELIIDGESGFLVHPSNHAAFASKIVTLLNNNELRASIGVHARERVENVFDIDKKAIENIEFYKTLIQ